MTTQLTNVLKCAICRDYIGDLFHGTNANKCLPVAADECDQHTFHLFHRLCLQKHLLEKIDCPTCGREIRHMRYCSTSEELPLVHSPHTIKRFPESKDQILLDLFMSRFKQQNIQERSMEASQYTQSYFGLEQLSNSYEICEFSVQRGGIIQFALQKKGLLSYKKIQVVIESQCVDLQREPNFQQRLHDSIKECSGLFTTALQILPLSSYAVTVYVEPIVEWQKVTFLAVGALAALQFCFGKPWVDPWQERLLQTNLTRIS